MAAPQMCNRGDTGLRPRPRKGDPMAMYDQLPSELRRWMAGANLPWSPKSCDTIWRKAKARGLSVGDRLKLLDRVEEATLKKAQRVSPNQGQ